MKKIKIIPTKEENHFKITIDSAKKHIPEWYKQSSQKIKGLENYSLVPNFPTATTSTYKKCSPFLDALTNGYIFCLSQDIEVIRQDDGSPYILWRGAGIDPISWHNNVQWEGLKRPENSYEYLYKWENSFVIKTPKRYSTLFTHPHNRFDLPFYTLSGVVDTDKFIFPIQFPFFIKDNFTGIIKSGTPVAQMTFFKRDRWFRLIKKYDKNYEKEKKFNFYSTIERPYKNIFWQKKEYE
jgi:hypothetical protein